jgi:hypothetical protein
MDQGFDAFLSYSHDDRQVVERISRRLRTYRPPRRSGPKRRLAVFRDVERLTAAPSLSGLLRERVRAARHFVLFASPESAASDYVNEEVRTFLADGDRARLLIVLLRGEMAEALPPALSLKEEPLYIDLRGADRRKFRLETLRLIAALYGVPYSELRREDEARRLRRQVAAGVAGVMAVLLAVSAYVVAVTPVEAWQPVQQPVTRTWSNALAPVVEVAVNRADPETVVWFGRNARHARDLDSATSSWVLSIFRAFGEVAEFADRAAAAVTANPGETLASLRLVVPDWRGDPAGELVTRLIGVLDGDTPRFVTGGFLDPADADAMDFGLSETQPGRWLESLDYAPAEQLRKAGFAGRDLTGVWIDGTQNGAERDIRYTGDFSDVAREVLDAVSAPEHLVFSNNPALEASLNARQEIEAAEDIWQSEIEGGGGWVVATEPERRSLSFDRERIETTRSGQASDGPVERELLQALVGMGEKMPRGDFYDISVATRPSAAVAVVRAYEDSHEVVQQPEPVALIRVGDAAWRQLFLTGATGRAAPRDIHLLADSGWLIVETDQAGLFRSRDGGANWEEMNFGLAALTRAEDLRLVVAAGDTVYVLAVLSREPGAAVNPLYRLEQRGVFTRWRIGLATLLLGGEPGEPLHQPAQPE